MKNKSIIGAVIMILVTTVLLIVSVKGSIYCFTTFIKYLSSEDKTAWDYIVLAFLQALCSSVFICSVFLGIFTHNDYKYGDGEYLDE